MISKKLISFLIIFVLSITISSNESFAESINDFDLYMNEFYDKKEMASKLLVEAEKALKEGDELNGCVKQRKASEYGIKATKALIKAMEVNNSTEGIENLEFGLRKWIELRDNC